MLTLLMGCQVRPARPRTRRGPVVPVSDRERAGGIVTYGCRFAACGVHAGESRGLGPSGARQASQAGAAPTGDQQRTEGRPEHGGRQAQAQGRPVPVTDAGGDEAYGQVADGEGEQARPVDVWLPHHVRPNRAGRFRAGERPGDRCAARCTRVPVRNRSAGRGADHEPAVVEDEQGRLRPPRLSVGPRPPVQPSRPVSLRRPSAGAPAAPVRDALLMGQVSSGNSNSSSGGRKPDRCQRGLLRSDGQTIRVSKPTLRVCCFSASRSAEPAPLLRCEGVT